MQSDVRLVGLDSQSLDDNEKAPTQFRCQGTREESV